jgi:hypothetical protein
VYLWSLLNVVGPFVGLGSSKLLLKTPSARFWVLPRLHDAHSSQRWHPLDQLSIEGRYEKQECV